MFRQKPKTTGITSERTIAKNRNHVKKSYINTLKLTIHLTKGKHMKESTKELITKALRKQSASEWARTYNTLPSTMTEAKRTGRLSPILAGNLAIDLGEDPKHWMAVAALENKRESTLKKRLKEHLA
jgi:hypothetical protein